MARSRNGEWTYPALEVILNGRDSATLMGNTRAIRYPGDPCITVRYHATDVAVLTPGGTVRLNSGGWRTVTTKARLNAVLPTFMGISQRDFAWYFTTWGPYGESETPFTEGMVVDTTTGRVMG